MPSGALRFPTFTPALATIAAISTSVNALVLTSFNHTFLEGQYITFLIPEEYGMTQLNGVTGLIILVNPALPNIFRTDVDTTAFDPFVVPMNPTQSAQAIPSGELATTYLNATKNVLPYP